jgi:hypothetical protein
MLRAETGTCRAFKLRIDRARLSHEAGVEMTLSHAGRGHRNHIGAGGREAFIEYHLHSRVVGRTRRTAATALAKLEPQSYMVRVAADAVGLLLVRTQGPRAAERTAFHRRGAAVDSAAAGFTRRVDDDPEVKLPGVGACVWFDRQEA